MTVMQKQVAFLCCLIATFFVASTASGQTWTPSYNSSTAGASNNWTDTSKWNIWYPNNSEAYATINTAVNSGTQTIYVSATHEEFGGLTLGSTGTGWNKVLVNAGAHMRLWHGTITAGGVYEIANGGSATWWRSGRILNGGTMIISSSGTFRFDAQSDGTFLVSGNLIGGSSSSGTAFLHTHGFGTTQNGNVLVSSTGKIVANAGTFYFETRGAYSNGGLQIQSGGQLVVSNNATFLLARSADAWDNGPRPTNSGTILMFGGTLTTARDGAVDRTMRFVNAAGGVIQGSGTLAFELVNNGSVIASNGTMNVTNVSGNAGAWIAKNSGTISFRNSVDLTAGSIDITGNWMAITNGFTGTLSSSFRSNNGTLIVGSSGGSATFQMANVGGLSAFTNSVNSVLTGRGTFSFGVTGGNSYGLVNEGTIAVGFFGAGDLVVHSREAAAMTFSNAPTGTVVVQSGRSFRIARDTTAWGTGVTPVNAGTIILNNGSVEVANSTLVADNRLLLNSGTILIQGTAYTGWRAGLENRGAIIVTNNNGQFTITGTLNVTNTASGNVFLGGIDGATATMVATNIGQLVNQGLIRGQGTLHLGRAGGGSGGDNANLVNTGTIIATNYGAATTGTLTINTGDAFSNSGFRNEAAGTVRVGSNTVLVLNRTANAWSGAAIVTNAGTVFMQGGTFTTSTDGGVAVTSANRTNLNTGLITGWGNFNMLVTNASGSAQILADARTIKNRDQGTLTVSLLSFTNNFGTTLGAIGTNSTLNLILPTGNALVNFGTVQFSAGNVVIQGGGVISNFFAIAGVGDLSTLPVVQAGSGASIIAKDPTDGFNDLLANVGTFNSSLLGAISNANGIATLRVSVTSGNTLSNAGTISLQGGRLTVNGLDGTISNTGTILGFGVLSNAVANLANGTIVASNGVLQFGAFNNLNAGILSNFNAASTIQLTNSILLNTGRIQLNSGGLRLTGSTITNEGTITGPGDISSALFNTSLGFVAATNGVLNIATNAGEFVTNVGTFDISSGSTLDIKPAAWLNTNGTVRLATGTLAGGTVTNKGTIAGQGTVSSAGVVNTADGTIRATNGNLFIRSTIVTQSGTMIGGSTGGGAVVITNLTQNLVNQGTMILDSSAGGNTNLAFKIWRDSGGSGDFTNDVGGVIRGAGFFNTADFTPGGQNFSIHNFGNIVATNGTLILQPGDAFGSGGFFNQAGGTVTVAQASTFGVQRTDNAWDNGTAMRNAGVIQINGGSLTLYGSGLAVQNSRVVSNIVGGVISGNGTIMAGLVNLGTVIATNGTLVLNNGNTLTNFGTITIRSSSTFTVLGGGTFQNSGGTMLFDGGTMVITNVSQFRNATAGVISGFGTLSTGRVSGSGGANAAIINTASSQIIATNGTLVLNPGDAFSFGGLSNSASSTIRVADGAVLVLNRTANAWDNSVGGGFSNPRNLGTISLDGGSWSNFTDGASSSGRFIENFGTITGRGSFSGSLTNFGTIAPTNGTLVVDGTGRFRQAGTLQINTSGILRLTNSTGSVGISFTNEANILMRGGELQAGVIANTNVIFGFGTISGGGVDNSGRLLASNGVLTASLSSFTNVSTATLGTLSTNAALDVTMPGGVGQPLINRGTINMAGGTLLFNGLSTGIISNRPTGIIQGVGNVTQTVQNNGTILAANPVPGLSVFSVGLSEFNDATIGASNNATLNIVLSSGPSFSNNGSISMIGGSLTINGTTTGVITNTVTGRVTGSGTVSASIVNNGTVLATVSGGVLDVKFLGATNSATGYIGAGLGATLQVADGLINLGTIGPDAANGGTIRLASASGILTNRGTILGTANLSFNSLVHNDPSGRINATNGVVNFNAINGLLNQGTINVANGGTFQSNSSNSWDNAGAIDMRGGTLRTGGFTNTATASTFTNSGVISGFGTVIGGGAYGLTGAGIDKSIVNLGTIIATNPLSGAAQTLYISTGGATSQDGFRNMGNIIVSSNNTLSLNRQAGLPILNTGTITIQNGTLTGSGVLSNTLGGIIQGYGTLTHDIVNLAGGTIRATNGNLALTSTINPINLGTFQVTAGATMTWNASNAWLNAGTIDMRGGTLRTGGTTNVPPPAGPFPGEPFTNANYIVGHGTVIGGGAFGGSGSGFDKSILNLGTIVASGGTLELNTGVATANRGLANLGTMIVATTNDTLILSRTAEIAPSVTNLNFIYNSGTILIHGGTLTSRTSITNAFESVSLPGLIQGFGHIALTNQLVNFGTIRSTNSVAGGNGEMHFVNPTGSSQLQINQSGTLVIEGGSKMIFGNTTNAALRNSGTIIMRGGYLQSGTLTNAAAARISGFGTITSPIINAGTLLANSRTTALRLVGSNVFNQGTGFFGATNGRLFVSAVFTNAGTVNFFNSVGTFASAVVNQGAWIMDPSTNVYLGDFTVASNGYITMTKGDVSIFKSNFVNVSTRSNDFDTVNGKFIFDGGGTQAFYVAGIDLGGANLLPVGTPSQTNEFLGASGAPIFGFSNNFALGTLQIGSLTQTSTLTLIDSFALGSAGPDDGNKAGLYVNNFIINAGSLLIISNNVEFYFRRSNGVTGVSFDTLNPGDNVLILGNGSFHYLAVVPEPSVLMLLMIGGIAIQWYRRRNTQRVS